MGSQYSTTTDLFPSRYQSTTGSSPYSGELKTFALTDTGDLSFGDGGRSPVFISGTARIKQDIGLIMKSVKGSSKYNPDVGFDVMNVISDDYDSSIVEYEVNKAVTMHPDVVRLRGINVKYRSEYVSEDDAVIRNYYVEFFAQITNGDEIFVSVII